jgi:L-seryl-tRNA(Ser) seleniumtransferase
LDEERAIKEVPTLRMLTTPLGALEEKASLLAGLLSGALGRKAEIKVEQGASAVGGGAMPTADLPTMVVAVRPAEMSAGDLQAALRQGDPAVMGRVHEDRLLLDVRTVDDTRLKLLAEAVAGVLNSN